MKTKMNDRKHSNASAPSDGVAEALRTMPELATPERVWANVRDRLDAPTRPARRPLARWAAAASVVVAVAAGVLVARWPTTSEPGDADIAALFERSRLVEAERRATPVVLTPSGVERVLQVRIGGIDALLNEQLLHGAEPTARQALLQERVELLEDLRHIERYRQGELYRLAAY